MSRFAALLTLMVAACGTGAPAPEGPSGPASAPAPDVSPLADDAVAGVSDEILASLLRDHWEHSMRQSPTWATTLGDHRFDDRLPDNSEAAIEAARAAVRQFHMRAKGIGVAGLNEADRITAALFTELLSSQIRSQVCEFHRWSVSAQSNPVVEFNRLPEELAIRSKQDADNLLARYRAVAASVDNTIEHLRGGAADGMVANAESVRRTLALVDGQLSQPIREWALMEPARRSADAPSFAGWAGLEIKSFRSQIEDAVTTGIAPAYKRYRDLLADELLPEARGPEAVGVGALPQGKACYEARILHHTGLPRTAQELHELGMREIARINDEMRALGKTLLGTDDLAAILARLRGDRALYFTTEAEIVAAAQAALDASRAAIGDYFGILPKAECVVQKVPAYEAPFTTIAYYRPPHYDGSKPGEYFINTYKPETRPRFELQVLSFHESIPGHHLQNAISQELPELPAMRKFHTNTAFGEGWALYTERLADEMGLYSGDLDRMGMLSYDAWRASRLVVDTGIHAMGWTRERAEQFMREHTALTEVNIVNEVDRYIGWPGQALAYKVGQLEIFRLRRWAEGELGERFQLAAFHDAVLRHGGVSLPVLAEQIERWVASVRGASAAP